MPDVDPNPTPPQGAPLVRAVLARDLPAVATRGAIVVTAISVGGQLVQALGGGEAHVAALRSAWSVGLLLSLYYAHLGRRRSPLQLIFWPEAVGLMVLASIGTFAGQTDRWMSPATRLTATVSIAIALTALTLPHIATVYGVAYPTALRARLVAYGRMVHGVVAGAAGFGFGRLFRLHPEAYRAVYPALAAVGLATAYAFYRMPVAEVRAPQPSGRRSAWAILRADPMYARFQAFQFLLGAANLGAIPVLDIYVRRELGLGIDSAVLVVTQGVVMQIVILLTVRAQSRLFDRLGVVRHRVLTSCLLASAYVVWAFTDGLPLALVAAVLAGLGMSGGQLIWMIGSLRFARREDLTTYSSIHTFLTGLRGIAAPPLGVWLVSGPLAGDFRSFFLGAAGLMALSAVGHALWVRVPEGAGA